MPLFPSLGYALACKNVKNFIFVSILTKLSIEVQEYANVTALKAPWPLPNPAHPYQGSVGLVDPTDHHADK